MVIIESELLHYDKRNIRYYINFPKLCYDKDSNKYEMIDLVNQIILEDIMIFFEVVEDSYSDMSENNILINSLTEFETGFNRNYMVSIAIEFSQLCGILDISYLKGYNYDLNLRKEIKLQDLFKENINFEEILKNYLSQQFEKLIKDVYISKYYGVDKNNIDNICIDNESIFYFTNEYLILPFSSCELSKDIMNLIEFKVPFNKIYHYLSDYAIKEIINNIIL